MATLCIHHHGVDHARVTFPFEPGALWPAGDIAAVTFLDHQPFMAKTVGAFLAQRGQCRPAVKIQCLGQVEARIVMPFQEPGQPVAARRKRQGANIRVAVEQHVINPDKGRQIAQMRLCCLFPVQPLLQVVKGLRVACDGVRSGRICIGRLSDQQFTIQHRLAAQACGNVREGG